MPSRETTLPRTWKLVMGPSGSDGEDFHVVAIGPEVGWKDAEEPRVIEMDTGLLDLLAFFVGLHGERYTMSEDAERDAEAILRAHRPSGERVQ